METSSASPAPDNDAAHAGKRHVTTPAPAPADAIPQSDVSSAVGFVGLAGLLLWIGFCRAFPQIAAWVGLEGEYSVLSGASAALCAMLFTAGPMVLWSVVVDRVHMRPSTGLDWSLRRSVDDVMPIAGTKLIGLWATWAILAVLYMVCRWYWDGSYLFAMLVLAYAVAPLIVISVPYVIWLERFMIEPRDSTWHFGALITGREGWQLDPIKKHWRAWIIKGFFTAFMISILPPGFAHVVEADIGAMLNNPVALGMALITLLFVIDVQLGTVGYLLTLRPLDAHIRSGNPFLAGWVAALMCYPPFVSGIIGSESEILSYQRDTIGWTEALAPYPTLAWAWAAWLVFLTGIYAWATAVFGIRFSNLTYRGVITHGPYRFTRHPAYVSKNLFWWFSVMPFLVASGSTADALRNCVFLLLVNGIYYWRARTEEAHLLAEDPKYRAYHDWMERHGPITSRLARLRGRVFGALGQQG